MTRSIGTNVHSNALVAAARDGDVRRIKTLAQQCDINARDEIGWCAVHRAAVHGKCKPAVPRRERGRPRRRRRRRLARDPPAAWVGDCPTLKALVELGAGVETACDATGETAVHVAARNGRLKAAVPRDRARCERRGARRLRAHGGALRGVGGPRAHAAEPEVAGRPRATPTTAATRCWSLVTATAACPWTTPTTAARGAAAWLRALAAASAGARRRPPPSAPASRSTPAPAKTPAPRTATPASARAATPQKSADAATATPAGSRRARRAALMASQLVAELQLTDARADALAAHLVAARGFATFEGCWTRSCSTTSRPSGPTVLLDVPRKKRAAAAVVESRRRVAIPGHRARDGGAGANVVVLFIQKAPHFRGPSRRTGRGARGGRIGLRCLWSEATWAWDEWLTPASSRSE